MSLCSQGREFHVREGEQIQPILDQLCPGDTVFLSGAHNERLRLTRSGTEHGGYITIRNADHNRPVLDGSGLGNGYMVCCHNVSYVKLQGLHITNYIGTGIIVHGEGTHVEIRDNEISNQQYEHIYGHGIFIDARHWPGPTRGAYTNVLIDGNYLHDLDTGESHAYNEALTVAMNVTRFRITNNLIERVPYIGIDMVGHYGQFPQYGIVSGNTVRHTGSLRNVSAIYIDGAKDIVIENNTLYDNQGHAIAVGCEQPEFMTEDIILRHNVAWNNHRNLTPICGHYGMVRNVRAIHNSLFLTPHPVTQPISNIALFKGEHISVKNNVSCISTYGRHVERRHAPGTRLVMSGNQFAAETDFPHHHRLHASLLDHARMVEQTRQSKGLGLRSFDSPHPQQRRPMSLSRGTGVALTRARTSDSGRSLPVQDSRYVHDGLGVSEGDLIQVNGQRARVLGVHRESHVVHLDSAMTWRCGDHVDYPFDGQTPASGAYELSRYAS